MTMAQKAPRLVGCLAETDEEILLRIVREHMPDGTTLDPTLVLSRLVAALGQRERLLGELQERLAATVARAKNAEAIVGSVRGQQERLSNTIRKATDGAVKKEREACAKVADAYRREDNTILVSAAEHIATRIRARGNRGYVSPETASEGRQ